MFSKTQAFYDAMYSFKDYETEAREVERMVLERCLGAGTLLDVACGTGKHLELLRSRFSVEGLELDPELAEIARERVGVVHVGDMRGFNLGKRFDVVTCLFSSIGYTMNVEGLEATLRCFAAHLNPGGVVLVEPWLDPSKYREGLVHALHYDDDDLHISRMNHTHRRGDMSVMEFHYLVGTREKIEHFTETHELMMFTAAEYQGAFEKAGLAWEYDEVGLTGRGLYLGSRGN